MSDEIVEYPMGVCNQDGLGSFMIQCDGYDTANYTTYYDDNCMYQQSTERLGTYFDNLGLTGFIDFEVTCCTGRVCPYANRTEHSTYGSNCSYIFSSDSSIEIIGGCRGFYENGTFSASTAYTSCSNGVLREESYFGSMDCSGDPVSLSFIVDGTCDGNGFLHEIECAQAIDTCPFNTTGWNLNSFAFFCIYA